MSRETYAKHSDGPKAFCFDRCIPRFVTLGYYQLLSSLLVIIIIIIIIIITINPHVNQAGDETDGDGLQLNLQIREMCKKYHKPHGPALATLNVSVRNGRPAKQCKELLGFLKDQVLPKTLKLINLKKIKDMKDEEKNELGANWLSCIRPGKTMKRFVARISPFLVYLMFLLAFLVRKGTC